MNPRAVLAAGVLGAFGVAMTMPAFAETDYVANYGIKEDVPGVCSYASIDAKDYTGHEITILTHAVPVMGEPVALHSKQFEELTGGTVNVVHAPFGELYHKVMIPFQTGQHIYDIVYGGSYWIGDWAPHLAPVPQKYLDTDEMKDITPSYQGVASWNGQRLQYTFDGDRNYFKYILPPFEDAENQAKFKAEYGRDLAVPTTWEEYAEVATFFSGWDWDGDGELEYGSTEIVKRDDVAFANFITRVASYAKNPNVTGGFWFDLDTMTPQVNNPGFVKGLEMWMDALRYMPPGGINFGIGDEIFSWGGGQSLMSVTWDDAFIQAMQPDSPIRNKIRVGTQYGPSMGSHKVWNRVAASGTSSRPLGRALRDLGLGRRRLQVQRRAGDGVRLVLLLLELRQHQPRPLDRSLRRQPLPHQPHGPQLLGAGSRLGPCGGRELHRHAAGHGHQHQPGLRPARSRRQSVLRRDDGERRQGDGRRDDGPGRARRGRRGMDPHRRPDRRRRDPRCLQKRGRARGQRLAGSGQIGPAAIETDGRFCMRRPAG